MKVLIVGSKRHMPPGSPDAARFEEACRQLGRRFAEKGHTLIVGTDDPLDADPFVVAGADEVPGKHTVVVSRPTDDTRSTPYVAGGSNPFKHVEFEFTRPAGLWTASLVHALAEADVLVIIGGQATAQAIGYSAAALKKPALAIPSFEGAGKAVWAEVSRSYPASGIAGYEIGVLGETWTKSSPEIAVRCAEALVTNSPFRRKISRSDAGVTIATVLLLAAWVALLGGGGGNAKDVAFYSMLTIAAVLGTTLRTSLRLLRREIVELDARTFLTEARAGVLIAFGFAMLYLAGGIVIAGKVVKLTSDEDFTRVAITMSILGFASALLIHEAAANLQERLLNALKGRRT